MTDQIPPSYSITVENNVGDLPPTYSAPTQFDIGSLRTSEPLVKISQVKGHLTLLHAFAELKKQVEELQEAVPHMPADLERRWAWFVALAVERFDIWCHALQSSDAQKSLEVTLPPLDVMMVWHAYMLNPMWYAEDCMRIPACKILKNMGIRFAALLHDPLQSLLSTPPSQHRLDFWVNKTALPFDHVQSTYGLLAKTIHCPQCRAKIVVDMTTHEGTGYLQQKFSTSCRRGCTGEITKETLVLRKMAQDLASGPESPLPGTLFNPSSPSAPAIGKQIKTHVRKNAQVTPSSSQSTQYDDKLCINIIHYAQFSLSTLKTQILSAQSGASRRIAARIMSAYVNDKDYSVELAGAIIRQGLFVKKMYDLGWTSPGFFDHAGNELALQHAISRYHAFLDLMASSPASFFVPTLDIDLVWHTHQLMSNKYEYDCTIFVGRFINHDDKVEGLQLSSAFDITCRAWKERFDVQYTHCGCPIPGDSIGKKLIRLIGAQSRTPPSHLLPFNRPDLLSATHPSDHNAVHFQSTNPRAHQLAKTMYENLARQKEREAQRAAKKAQKKVNDARRRSTSLPALLPPHAPGLQNSRPEPLGTYPTSRRSFYTPFLVPVPIFFGLGGGLGLGAGLAGCVVSDGYVVNTYGSCGGAGCNGGVGCGGGFDAGGISGCGGVGANCSGGGGCGGGCGGGGCGGS